MTVVLAVLLVLLPFVLRWSHQTPFADVVLGAQLQFAIASLILCLFSWMTKSTWASATSLWALVVNLSFVLPIYMPASNDSGMTGNVMGTRVFRDSGVGSAERSTTLSDTLKLLSFNVLHENEQFDTVRPAPRVSTMDVVVTSEPPELVSVRV